MRKLAIVFVVFAAFSCRVHKVEQPKTQPKAPVVKAEPKHEPKPEAKHKPPFKGGDLTPKPNQAKAVAFFEKAISEIVGGKFSITRVWWYRAPCIVSNPETKQCLLGLARALEDGCEVSLIWGGNFHAESGSLLAHEMTHCALFEVYGNADGEHRVEVLWKFVEEELPKMLPFEPKMKNWLIAEK